MTLVDQLQEVIEKQVTPQLLQAAEASRVSDVFVWHFDQPNDLAISPVDREHTAIAVGRMAWLDRRLE